MSRIYVQCLNVHEYLTVLRWKVDKGHVWPSGNPVKETPYISAEEYKKHGSNTTICIDSGFGMAKLESALKKGHVISFREFSQRGDVVLQSSISNIDSSDWVKITDPNVKGITINNNNQKQTTMRENIKSVMGFAKVSNEQVALTFSGKLAVQRKDGQYVRYDDENDAISVQSILPTVKIGKFCFCMPTPASSLKIGDIILHKNDFKEVTRVEGGLKAINLNSGAENGIKKEVIEGLAGLSMIPKLTCLFNGGTMDATNSLNPMMMMMLMKDGKDGGNKMNDILPLMLMGQGGQQNAMLPMMLAMGDGDIDPMMLMMMSQTQGQTAQQGAMNPMMLMAMMGNDKGGSNDMMLPLMMSGMMGGKNPFTSEAPVTQIDSKDAQIAALKAQLEANTVDPRDAEIEALKAQIEAGKTA